jgi:hypothetical protein
MVEMALELLSAKHVVQLDEERKASMVSNLLVVLCSDRDAQPVVNAGTLYQPDVGRRGRERPWRTQEPSWFDSTRRCTKRCNAGPTGLAQLERADRVSPAPGSAGGGVGCRSRRKWLTGRRKT